MQNSAGWTEPERPHCPTVRREHRMHNLMTFQPDFAVALFDPAVPVPESINDCRSEATRRRFGVYRNNVVAGLVSALEERFPVTRRIVGDDCFRHLAQAYLRALPPRSPILLLYGESFPSFIETVEPVRAIEYLPDVARLEFARGVAYHASDRPPCSTAAFTTIDPVDLGRSTVELHPSVSLMASRFPIVSIWETHQGERVEPIEHWDAEAALIVRPFLEVDVWRLPAGGHLFLDSLAAGSNIQAAMERAAACTSPEFNPAACLSVLIGSNMVLGLTPG